MYLFFKHKRKQEPSNDSNSNKLANRLKQRLIKAAGCLQQYSNGLSAGALKSTLALFCLLFSSISIGIMLNSFQQNITPTVFITAIRLPPHALDNGNTHATVVITDGEYKQLQLLEHYLDSLQQTPSGKVMVDSLLQTRPGLMDSVHQLKSLYLQQQILKK